MSIRNRKVEGKIKDASLIKKRNYIINRNNYWTSINHLVSGLSIIENYDLTDRTLIRNVSSAYFLRINFLANTFEVAGSIKNPEINYYSNLSGRYDRQTNRFFCDETGWYTITADSYGATSSFNIYADYSRDQSISSLFYKTGWYANEVWNLLTSSISGKNITDNRAIYSTKNPTSGIYVRNTGLWCSGIDLTCVSPWNNTLGEASCATLISQRHIIFPQHYQLNNGATVHFITNNNELVTRTMTSKTNVTNLYSNFPDITIGVLNADVGTGIKPAMFLNSGDYGYIPSIFNTLSQTNWNAGLCSIWIDGEEKAIVKNIWSSVTAVSQFASIMSFAPTSAQSNQPIEFINFNEDGVLGDSGSPNIIPFSGRSIIMGHTTFSNGGGPFYPYQINNIQNAMDTLLSGYSLEFANLSGYMNTGLL